MEEVKTWNSYTHSELLLTALLHSESTIKPLVERILQNLIRLETTEISDREFLIQHGSIVCGIQQSKE